MRRSIATPCPVAPNQYTAFENTYHDDTTTDIDFTTAFKASFRNVKPRRVQVARRGTTNFAIHEDNEGPALPVLQPVRGSLSTLSHPAKRVIPPIKTRTGTEVSQDATSGKKGLIESRNAKPQRSSAAPRRLPASVPIVLEVVKDENDVRAQPVKQIERDERRRTLYMPSEDTTQPTMWMGIFSPVKNGVLAEDQADQVLSSDLTGIAARMAEKKRRRTSTMQSKAKRLPLQNNATAQEKAVSEDRAGAPTGKENVPPNQMDSVSNTTRRTSPVQKRVTKKEPVVNDRDFQRRQFLAQARLDQISKPRGSRCSSPDVSTMYEIGKSAPPTEQSTPKKRLAWNAGPRVIAKDECWSRTSSPKAHFMTETKPEEALAPKIPTRFVRPILQHHPNHHQHLPILEHIENPALYEEDWLGQQEVVVTQFLNSLFEQAQGKTGRIDEDKSRKVLVGLYNSPEIALVHSRVQAAVLYGSLSLSHEAMFQMQNLVKDVGRRRQYLKFWTDNYDNNLLKVALEVVTGRQVNVRNARTSSGSSPAKSGIRKLLEQFTEAFLLRNEDVGFKSAGTGASTNDLGSRTILRSLMLLKALDLLQQHIGAKSGTCLFRRNATFKSSAVAGQTLMRLINPAVGDSLRALRQLGYEVYHEQQAIEEVSYRIENIAVDLRDGAVLTRLVELLLYKTSSKELGRAHEGDATTVCMPEGETLLIGAHNTWPLSHHLKVPCVSRATKVWNVQVALAALGHVKGISKFVEDVSAEDIVDGHREKTIKLLWALVGRYGLVGIVDWDDLKQEVRRLNASFEEDLDEVDASDEKDVQAQCEYLLKAWTRAVAASKGEAVRNFTTGFSDGRIFKAILDEYEPYLRTSASSESTLQQRLLQLGCSRQFSELFSHTNGQMHIFGKEFVLAALAFLCSRVVGPSKLCRKAIMIQRCWRKHWQAVQKERQAVKRALAEACATSINIRQDFRRNTNIAYADLVSKPDDRTEIDDDIWLSL
ncbi:hypothetical protein LTR70_000048 [Exophiala xenobiotica]|uniref:Calponin-homology (CH) domain-containing protein n=1 Tax=Lithohypha guttulata TaxID=1690604 RepID=A0ABR0KNY2_9EURO|nr:hypothetical protein LTR24_000172 [Lithohypha guttulata]KAK5330726.1 hypothetical protein LTR70_000048 [Exophiala xenobiotica]